YPCFLKISISLSARASYPPNVRFLPTAPSRLCNLPIARRYSPDYLELEGCSARFPMFYWLVRQRAGTRVLESIRLRGQNCSAMRADQAPPPCGTRLDPA